MTTLPTFRRILCPLTLVLLCLSGCRPKPVQPPPTNSTGAGQPEVSFSTRAERILDRWFAARPTVATSLGEHRHDDRWPDLSPAGLAADERRIDEDLTALERIAATGLNQDERIDLEMLRNELALQRFIFEVERPHRRDPLWYVSAIGNGIEDLVSRDYAAVDARARTVAARLGGLPKFIEQARDNLHPSECLGPHTAVAIGQLEGVVALIEHEVPSALAEADPELRGRILAATPKAITALQGLRAYLVDEIQGQAKGEWRLGAQGFGRKLRLTLQTDITPEQLQGAATAEHGRIRDEMARVAGQLATALFSRGRLAKLGRQPDADAAIVRAVLAELGAAHVEADRLRDAVESTVDRLTAFVSAQNIVPLDPKESLQVIWTPPHQRGVFVAGLAAPGPLETRAASLPSFYLVQPIPETWPAATRKSLLREYNNFMLEILSIHEAVPGHFIQQYYAKRDPSMVRKVLANGAFVEGWAVYAERVMIDKGYGGAAPAGKRPRGVSRGLWRVLNDPQLRAKAIALHGLKFYLRSVTNALVDHGVHAGDMTEDQAIALMVERSFQEPGEARGKWVRAQLTSTQLSTYFVGAQGWLRLRDRGEAEARKAGVPFDLAEFHRAALSHGAPPLSKLPALLGWAEGAGPDDGAPPR